MSIYVMFPVAVFYYFNLPDFYEKYVSAKRVSLVVVITDECTLVLLY